MNLKVIFARKIKKYNAEVMVKALKVNFFCNFCILMWQYIKIKQPKSSQNPKVLIKKCAF